MIPIAAGARIWIATGHTDMLGANKCLLQRQQALVDLGQKRWSVHCPSSSSPACPTLLYPAMPVLTEPSFSFS